LHDWALVKGRNSIIISGIVLAFIAGTFVSGTQVFGAAQSGWKAAVTELEQELDDLFGDIGDLKDDIDAETIDRIAGDADVLLEAQNDLIIHADDPSAHHDGPDSQVYEVSVTIPIGISDSSLKPFSLRCLDGDWMYVSDNLVSSLESGSNPEGVAGSSGDLLFLKDGNKNVGVEGLAKGSLQFFEHEIFITIICLSPTS